MQIGINSFDTQKMACNSMLICKILKASWFNALYSDIALATTSKGLVVAANSVPL